MVVLLVVGVVLVVRQFQPAALDEPLPRPVAHIPFQPELVEQRPIHLLHEAAGDFVDRGDAPDENERLRIALIEPVQLIQQGLVLRMARALVENALEFLAQILKQTGIESFVKVGATVLLVVVLVGRLPAGLGQKFHPFEVPDHARDAGVVAFLFEFFGDLLGQQRLVSAEERLRQGIVLKVRSVRDFVPVLVFVRTPLAQPTQPANAQAVQHLLRTSGVRLEIAQHVPHVLVRTVVRRGRQEEHPVRHGRRHAFAEKAPGRFRTVRTAIEMPQVMRLVDDDQVERRLPLRHQALPNERRHPSVQPVLIAAPFRHQILLAPRLQPLLPTLALNQPRKRRDFPHEKPRPLRLNLFHQFEQVAHLHRRLHRLAVPPQHRIIPPHMPLDEGRVLRNPVLGHHLPRRQDEDACVRFLLPQRRAHRQRLDRLPHAHLIGDQGHPVLGNQVEGVRRAFDLLVGHAVVLGGGNVLPVIVRKPKIDQPPQILRSNAIPIHHEMSCSISTSHRFHESPATPSGRGCSGRGMASICCAASTFELKEAMMAFVFWHTNHA